jgi:MFS family permease
MVLGTENDKGSCSDCKKGSFTDLVKDSPRDLWLIFALKALWALAEFSLASVLVLFLSDDLSMTDTDAGWVFGLTGLVKAVYGLACGFAVDMLGVRWSLLLGSFMMTTGLLIVACTQSTIWAISALLTVKAFGSALLLNPMMFAVRRYTTASTRPYAFSLFYVCMNASSFVAQIVVNLLRNSKAGPLLPYVHWASPTTEMTLWRLVIWLAVVSGGLTFLLSMLVRETPLAADDEGTDQSRQKDGWKMIKMTLAEAKFWRLVALCTVFVGVRLIFVHMHATFPKFLIREMDANAPFELLIAINPAFIMALVPPFTMLTQKFQMDSYPVLLLGATFTALSPLPMAFHEHSYMSAIAFVAILSIGEALWSPKLYEHTVAVSPVGREGTYGALAVAPVFASTFFAGGFSGHMLQEHCPHSGHCNGYAIWILVFATTVTSPLILLLCRPCLFHKTDWVQEAEIAHAHHGQSYGTTSDSNSKSQA